MSIVMRLPSRFRALPRPAAAIALATAVLVILGLLWIALSVPQTDSAASSNGGDLAMYGRLVDRMRHGEDYYAAARTELSAGHYAMQSVFNWRTPLLPWFLSLFPTLFWPQVLFMLATLLAAGLSCKLVFDEVGWIAAGLLAIVEILALGTCLVPQTVAFSEFAAGVLILLSASAYGLRRPYLGLGAAALALFVRELAAPYVLIAIYLAWRQKRYGELKVWALVLFAYAGYFLWHTHMVQLHQSPGDLADHTGWVEVGGAPFLLDTSAFNGFFLLTPLWVTALVLPLCCLGLLAWPGAAGQRMALTLMTYLLLFAFVGKSYNEYWGAIYTPVMSVGLVLVPTALRDLWRALWVKAETEQAPSTI